MAPIYDLPPATCTDTCPFANNSRCDDGGAGSASFQCLSGTDCTDCGSRAPPAPPSYPRPPAFPPYTPGMKPFRVQPDAMSESQEIAFIVSAVGLYAISMMGALVCFSGLPITRAISLTYFTSLAASDFYSDLIYIFTQTFMHPTLFAFAIVVTFAPTLAYLTFTGLFHSLFTKMIPACLKASAGAWVVVFYGASGLKICDIELPDQAWLWLVLKEWLQSMIARKTSIPPVRTSFE